MSSQLTVDHQFARVWRAVLAENHMELSLKGHAVLTADGRTVLSARRQFNAFVEDLKSETLARIARDKEDA